MVQAAEISETDDVLVVGCASGYLAALAAHLARRVTATECDSALAAKAAAALATLALGNVTVKSAPVADGDSAGAPFDVILLNGATEIVPESLYRQLKEGGRLVGAFALTAPQRAMVVTHSHDDFGHRALFDTAIPVLVVLERLPAQAPNAKCLSWIARCGPDAPSACRVSHHPRRSGFLRLASRITRCDLDICLNDLMTRLAGQNLGQNDWNTWDGWGEDCYRGRRYFFGVGKSGAGFGRHDQGCVGARLPTIPSSMRRRAAVRATDENVPCAQSADDRSP